MDDAKQVRDFLEPVVRCAGQDSVDQVLATLSRGDPVAVTQSGRWHLLLPEMVAGCPSSRRVIDLPLLQVPRVSLNLSAQEASTRLAERRVPYALVVDGDRLLGVVAEKRLLEYRHAWERERVERALTESQQALARRTAHLEALRAISEEITRELDLTSLLQLIVKRATELLGVPAGSVRLWDEEAQVLTMRAWQGHGDWFGGVHARLGEGIAGRVAERRQGMIVNNYRTSQYALPTVLDRTTITDILAEPLLYRNRLLGVITADNLGTRPAFTDEDCELLSLFATQAAIAIENARLFQSVTEQHAQLRSLMARLAGAEEDHRKRLSRELHDCVGGNLTALSLNLMIAQSQMSSRDASGTVGRIEECSRLVEEAGNHIRSVMTELRPPLLDDHGLLAALRWYAEQFSTHTAVTTVIQGEEPSPRLPRVAEIALFRIAQEALTNAAKHAQATHLTIALTGAGERVRLMVSDDGIGFDPTHLHRPGGRGWGLLTMRERAEAVGGTFRMDSTPGKGTRVIVEVSR